MSAGCDDGIPQRSISTRPDDRLVISVAAVKNAEIVGVGRITGVTPPLAQERRIFSFEARCPAIGPAEFLVEVWRGAARLCEAKLKAKAGAKAGGAARTSFLTKCQKDATAACNTQAADKKLHGAAQSSFTTKCVKDAVGQ
ncbi:hypothetical protein [Xanthobacter autotrophicus]|uniref:hypothetical protein n=1 Tax=Xanthobacter autotrophicus TaxID=280 RepID=UPI0037280E8E